MGQILHGSTTPSFWGTRLDLVHIPDPRSHALQGLNKQRSRFQNEIADIVCNMRRFLFLERASTGA